MTSKLPAITLETLSGHALSLASFAGQVLLVVNTASACGFTPQFAGLQQLHERYGALGFTVLGVPCNQFGHQDPGDAEEIGAFCSQNYGVGFPMMAKVDVNGPKAHPLFVWLKRQAPGVLGSEGIKWNFTKFLVGRDGEVKKRYGSMEKPALLAGDIEAALAEADPAR